MLENWSVVPRDACSGRLDRSDAWSRDRLDRSDAWSRDRLDRLVSGWTPGPGDIPPASRMYVVTWQTEHTSEHRSDSHTPTRQTTTGRWPNAK